MVAVLVLNWQKYQLTRSLLAQLTTVAKNAAIYLIDNQSDPQALSQLAQDFPQVTTLPLKDNLGFAAAMNRGSARALSDGAQWILWLNNDIRMTAQAFEALLDARTLLKGAPGLIAPKLIQAKSGKIEGCGISVNLKTGRIRQNQNPGHLPFQSPAASGACLLIHRSVFEIIGHLDPEYFFYFEDIDFCLRAQKAGFKTLAHPQIEVEHLGSATMGKNPIRHYYALRNQLRLIQRHGPHHSASLRALKTLFITALHGAQGLGERGPSLRTTRYLTQALYHHFSQRYGPLEAMPQPASHDFEGQRL